MDTRNCAHFAQEAARRARLTKVEFPALMKKPRSFLKAVANANAEQVTLVDRDGKEYLAHPCTRRAAHGGGHRARAGQVTGTSSITLNMAPNGGSGSAMRQRRSPTRSTKPAMSRVLSRP